MKGWVARLLLSLGGATLGALLVALVEARAATSTAGAVPVSYGAVVLADLGVLGPIAVVVALFVAVLAIYLEPVRMTTFAERARTARAAPILERSRTAALAPLVIVGFAVWCTVVANAAKAALADGAPLASGVGLALITGGSALAVVALALALLAPLRRVLASLAARSPRVVDPITTGVVGALLAALVLVAGLASGDVAGDGPGPFAVFGVLKRNELDLRPVVNLAAIAVFAYAVPMALASRPRARWHAAVALAAVLASVVVTQREANAMNQDTAPARAVEQSAPLGKIALSTLRHATDRDHDGASPLFGGGDCNDRDKSISPNAVDVPGNGVDEDCSGEDTPAYVEPVAATPSANGDAGTSDGSASAAVKTVDRDLNLIVITVDTLRPDVGFMGWTNETTPNLDKLAAKATVFDRAYSMASYTGKSVAPMMIGKYPSETLRDGGHFNVYSSANTFVAERVKAAGIRTMGGGAHWYFGTTSGLNEGMTLWDTAAIPDHGQGQDDTSITSPALTDEALKILGNPENVGGRFYLWLHYFDPHAQYMSHGGAPRFPQGSGQVAAMRAGYDGEIWFTDHHIGRLLDFIAEQPWAENTAIVVTSDHGEAFLEHGHAYHGIDIYEELVRVPLVVYLPGGTPHHVARKRSQIDLVPTLLDILGISQPAAGELSGQSMLGCILGSGDDDACDEKDVLIDMPDGPNTKFRRALIHGTTPGMKLIHSGGTRYELFDLANDPGETHDLSGDETKMAAMKAAFAAKQALLKEIYVKADDPPY